MTVSTSVKIEHLRETLGIGTQTPRISWRFEGGTKNFIQSAYEIEISRPGLEPELFKVESEQSIFVPWPSTPLKSREQVTVRVRAFGGEEFKTTECSKPVEVEVGLLEKSDWTAKLIGAERIRNANGSLRPTLFRKVFEITKVIKKARLYITSYGAYYAKINGKRVGDHVLAPGWSSYNHRLFYQAFDVKDQLQNEETVFKEDDTERRSIKTLEIEVGEGWYCGRLGWGGGKRNIYGDQLAVLAQLEVLFEDGEKVVITSDGTWNTTLSPRIYSELYDGELFNSSLATSKIQTPSEDAKSVQELPFPPTKLLASEAAIKKTQVVQAQKIWKSPSGKVIVDFGQNLVGGVRIKVQGEKGRAITLTHTEVLENDEVATRPLRDCKATDTIILGESIIEWEPAFTFHGFRYLQVDNWPTEDGMPSLEGDLQALVIHTDMEVSGWFECSNSMVNQLHENIRWGMRGNFVGLPTDCPQRDERLGWTGDIQVFCPTANFLYDTTSLLSNWLQDLALEQMEDYDGVVPQVVPNVIDPAFNRPQAIWGDVAVITPWTLFNSFGDEEFLLNQYDSMKAWLNAIPRGSNMLWDQDTHQLGDWLDPSAPPSEPANGKTDPHFTANAYLVYVTQLMVKIASKLEKPSSEVQDYADQAAELKAEFQANYVTPSGRLSPDTQTSLSLALSFSLFNRPSHTAAAASRLARLACQSRFRIATGFAGTPLILPALTSSGHSQTAYRMLEEKGCPSWLYTVSMGATTMWERWDSMLPDGSINPGEMTSFNHYALGSVGYWLHSSVGGISELSPGWKDVLFAPVPGGSVTWAKVSHLSPYGLVKCEWKIEGGVFKMEIQVPPNSRGVVRVPGEESERRVGSGNWVFEAGWKEKEWPPKALLDPFAGYTDLEEGESKC